MQELSLQVIMNQEWHTWPSIMYEIMKTWSVAGSGNFKGNLVVSISKANTIVSGVSIRSLRRLMETVSDPLNFTVYHRPTQMLMSMDTRIWYGTSYSLQNPSIQECFKHNLRNGYRMSMILSMVSEIFLLDSPAASEWYWAIKSA